MRNFLFLCSSIIALGPLLEATPAFGQNIAPPAPAETTAAPPEELHPLPPGAMRGDELPG